MTDYFMLAGSRHWTDKAGILATMLQYCDGVETMLDGACPTGADQLGYEIWHGIFGFPVERFPIQWQRYGNRAAYLRDMQMIDKRPKLLLAFLLHGEENKGTKLAIKLAIEADIRVIEVKS